MSRDTAAVEVMGLEPTTFYVAKEETGHQVPPGAAKYQVAVARAARCHHMPRGTRAIDVR